MNHCIEKVAAIVERGEADRRSVFQLGYNLGRLGELTGLGREAFWDRWKEAVESWDLPKLRQLALDLPMLTSPLGTAEENQVNLVLPDLVGD